MGENSNSSGSESNTEEDDSKDSDVHIDEDSAEGDDDANSTKADLEMSNFEELAYDLFFYNRKAGLLWSEIQAKPIWSERVIEEESFKKYGLYQLLEKRGLLGTVDAIVPYVEEVVREFWCNLSPNTFNIHSPKCFKAYVRGRVYTISPELINLVLGTPSEEETDLDTDMDGVVKELTNGVRKEWKNRLPVKITTSSISVLFRVCICNWLPTKNNNVLTMNTAKLLYRIKVGLNVNIGEWIFQHMGELHKRSEGGSLIFPSLIYHILSGQGLKPLPGEKKVHEFREVKVTPQLLNTAERVCDLPWKEGVETRVNPGVASTSGLPPRAKTVSAADQVLWDQLADIDKKIDVLQDMRQTIVDHLSSQKGGE